MQEVDCALIVDGGLGPIGQRQLAELLDAHRKAGIRTGLMLLRSDRTEWGWLASKDLIDRIDSDRLVWIDPSHAMPRCPFADPLADAGQARAHHAAQASQRPGDHLADRARDPAAAGR